MKKVLILTLFVLKFSIVLSQTTHFDKNKVNSLITNYITMLQNTYSDKNYFDFMIEGDDYFGNFGVNEVEYYKNSKISKSAAQTFFRIINTNIAPVETDFPIDIKDYTIGCVYNFKDPDTNKIYYYVFSNFNQTVFEKNQKITTDYLVQVDISTYKIKEIYIKTLEKELIFFKNCSTTNTTANTSSSKDKITEFKNEYLKNAEEFKNNKQYFKAIKTYNKALKLDPNNQTVLNDITFCKSKLSIKNYMDKVEILILDKKYLEAQKQLKDFRKLNPKQQESWVKEKEIICKKSINKREYENLVSLADVFYTKKIFNKALFKYKEASHYNIATSYVFEQIEKCKKGDPLFVQKQLKIAYMNAVKSKKNYLSTFKIYKKYESSKLLTGSQYYFMALMMLDKHTKISKPMGYSKNQAKHLSRKYFYMAKDLGYDVSYIESQVFTKSIEKRN